MAIHTVSLHDAESHLADLTKLVEEGEEVVITRGDGRTFQLVVKERSKKQRTAGLHRGKIHMQDDFDEPLGDDFWLGNDK